MPKTGRWTVLSSSQARYGTRVAAGQTAVKGSTLDAAKFGFTQKRVYQTEEQKLENPEPGAQKELPLETPKLKIQTFGIDTDAVNADGVKLCKIEDPDCEACQ